VTKTGELTCYHSHGEVVHPLKNYETFLGRGNLGCSNAAVSFGRRGLRIRQYNVRSDGDTADSVLTKRLYNRTSTVNVSGVRFATVLGTAVLHRDLAMAKGDLQDMQDLQEENDDEFRTSNDVQFGLLAVVLTGVLVLFLLVIKRVCRDRMTKRRRDQTAKRKATEQEEEKESDEEEENTDSV